MNIRRWAISAAGVFAGYAAFAWYAVRRLEDLEPESAGAPGTFIDIDGVDHARRFQLAHEEELAWVKVARQALDQP